MQTPERGHEVIVVDTSLDSSDSEQGSDGEGGDDKDGAAARDADAPASDEDGTDDDEEANGSVYSPSEFAVESEDEVDDYDMDSDDDLDRNAGFGHGGSANGPIREGPARCVTRSAAAGQQETRAPRRQSRRVTAAAAAVAGASVAAAARAKAKEVVDGGKTLSTACATHPARSAPSACTATRDGLHMQGHAGQGICRQCSRGAEREQCPGSVRTSDVKVHVHHTRTRLKVHTDTHAACHLLLRVTVHRPTTWTS